jgi:anti-sigma factor RsiW
VKDEDQELICRYLLGELPDDEQAELERRYFTDDELFERLLKIEDELIDKYVRGEFSDQECERLEKHFLKSKERHKRVIYAQAVMRALAGMSKDASRHRRRLWGKLKSLLHIKSNNT